MTPQQLSSLSGQTQAGSGAYGTVPTVPSPQSTQSTALSGDISQLGNISSLTTGLDSASAGGYLSSLESLIPGYSGLSSTASSDISSLLSGQLPQDVLSQLNTQAAQRGVSFDASSPNTDAAALRAMGLTSLNLEQSGLSGLQGLIGENQVTQANPSAGLVSPSDQQSAQTAANVYASSPNPSAAAAANLAAAKTGTSMGASQVPTSSSGVPLASTGTGYSGGSGGSGTGGVVATTSAALSPSQQYLQDSASISDTLSNILTPPATSTDYETSQYGAYTGAAGTSTPFDPNYDWSEDGG